MSAPSKIAAIRHAVSALHGAADDGSDTRRYADALQEAGAVIDALIEASKKLHIVTAGLSGNVDAHERAALDIALTRLKGGAA